MGCMVCMLEKLTVKTTEKVSGDVVATKKHPHLTPHKTGNLKTKTRVGVVFWCLEWINAEDLHVKDCLFKDCLFKDCLFNFFILIF